MLTRPEHPISRDILKDKYGVALPQIHEKSETGVVKQKIVTGCTVEPLASLPRSNRIDPSVSQFFTLYNCLMTFSSFEFLFNWTQYIFQRTPPPVSEDDAKKGILSLLERGLIPVCTCDCDCLRFTFWTISMDDINDRCCFSFFSLQQSCHLNLLLYGIIKQW